MKMPALLRRAAALPPAAFGLLPAGVCALAGLFQPAYDYIDNYIVAVITNGLLGSDTNCQYCSPLLGQLVGALARRWPSADWYTLLGRLLLLVSIWWLGTVIARCQPPARRFWYCLPLTATVAGTSLFNTYYTVQAAFFAFAGGTTLLLAARRGWGRAPAVMGGALFCLGLIWRPESAELFLPFLLLGLGSVIAAGGRGGAAQRLRRVLRAALPAILCAAAVFGAGAALAAPGRAYNNARMTIVDWPMKDWTEVADTLAPMTENDYRSVRRMLLADTDRIDTAYLQKVAAAGHTTAYPLTIRGFLGANRELFSALLGSKTVLFLGALLAALTLLALCSRPPWHDVTVPVLAFGGAWLILLVFTWLGRAPTRVSTAVLYALLMTVSVPLLDRPLPAPAGRAQRTLCALLTVLSLGGAVLGMAAQSGGGVPAAADGACRRAAERLRRKLPRRCALCLGRLLVQHGAGKILAPGQAA